MAHELKTAFIGGVCGVIGAAVGAIGTSYFDRIYKPSDWSGQWETVAGFTGTHPYTFSLNQHGSEVGGTYTGISGTESEGIHGILFGKAEGPNFKGIWQRLDRPTDPGTFVLTLHASRDEFSGSYRDGESNGKWHGSRESK